MAKFAKQEEEPIPPVERSIPTPPPVVAAPVTPPVVVVDVNNNNNNSSNNQSTAMNQQTVQLQSIQATAQAEAQVGLAEVSVDKEMADQQIKKEDEHWMKAYWRPAMGWLYMVICLCDFIVFPIIAMFMPVFLKGLGVPLQYVPWQSLTLSNGGLIHLAFGAILGITSYTRGQEKLAGK